MAKDVNKCIFIGRLGQDPEVKYMANGKPVANLSIACSDDYKDKNTGQKVEQTNWIRIVAYDRLAEIIGEYVKKGSKIYIEGKQVTRKWQDQRGQDRYTTEIIASEMQMLDSRGDGAITVPVEAPIAGPAHSGALVGGLQQRAPAPQQQYEPQPIGAAGHTAHGDLRSAPQAPQHAPPPQGHGGFEDSYLPF